MNLKNFMSMGLGRDALGLYFPSQKQSLIELVSIGRSAFTKAFVMFSKSCTWRSAFDVLGGNSFIPYMTTLNFLSTELVDVEALFFKPVCGCSGVSVAGTTGWSSLEIDLKVEWPSFGLSDD